MTSRGTLPLSAAQLGVWFAQLLDQEDPSYNVGGYLEIHGPVEPGLFEAALRQAVREAQCLNVRFQVIAGEPRQVLDATRGVPLEVADISAAADPQHEALAWMTADLARPVDLISGRLLRNALFRVAPDRFFWYHRVHHILLDGYGSSLFARRVAEIYTAKLAGRPPGRPAFGSLADFLSDEAALQPTSSATGSTGWLVSPIFQRHRVSPPGHQLSRLPRPAGGRCVTRRSFRPRSWPKSTGRRASASSPGPRC